MKQIKIVHKGACRYVPVTDANKLDKFIRDGWETARDANGKLIITELTNARDARNISTKTNDILAAIHAEIAEATDLADASELIDLDEE